MAGEGSITVVIPAHNEAAVIVETLRALTGGGDGLEVLVVCNGCTDGTAAAAAGVAGVRVMESPVPSKVNAVNLGLREARGEVVVCVDADIRLGGAGVAGLARALERPGVLAAAPRVEMDFAPGTAWGVRAYYRVWFALPYVSEGMVGCGVYALNAAGRARIGEIPELIADDGFVRSSFAAGERVRVDETVAKVRGPRTLRDLIKIKTRSRLGGYQLRQRFPEGLPGQGGGARHGSAWAGVLMKPSLWACVPAYLYVNIVSRLRAKGQVKSLAGYVWERDESSRNVAGAAR